MLRNLSVAIAKPTQLSWSDAGAILRNVEKACVCAANLAATHFLRADTQLFEATFVKQGAIRLPMIPPKRKQDKPKVDVPNPDAEVVTALYRNVARQFPFVSSKIISNVIQDVRKRYWASRFRAAVGKKRSPTYRTSPIPQDRYSLRYDGKTFFLSIALLSTKGSVTRKDKDSGEIVTIKPKGRIEFILKTAKMHAWQKTVLEELADGRRKLRLIKLDWKKKNKKWMVFIPYEPVEHEIELKSDRTLEVFPPGRGEILKAAFFKKKGQRTSKTDVWSVNIEFDSAVGLLASYERRSRAISHKYQQDSTSASVGHGRKRALQNKEKWQAKYARSAKTLNQQRAAFIVKKAIAWKCSKIVFQNPGLMKDHDYNLLPGWRWYEFGQCLKNAAENAGIDYEESNSEKFEEFLQKWKAAIKQEEDFNNSDSDENI